MSNKSKKTCMDGMDVHDFQRVIMNHLCDSLIYLLYLLTVRYGILCSLHSRVFDSTHLTLNFVLPVGLLIN